MPMRCFLLSVKQKKKACVVLFIRLISGNGLWENPQQMSSEINKPNTTNTHPQWAFWKEQEGLFSLLIERAGEVWIFGSHLKKVLLNLGGTINTTGDEVARSIIRLNKSYISVLIFIQELVV